MSRGIIIVGNESALLSAIESEMARRAERHALALIPSRLSGSPLPNAAAAMAPDAAAPSRIVLDWIPGSAISARTLLIAAENRLERIDEAVFVCDPPPAGRAVANVSIADVEVMLNDQVKGWFFLARELAAAFRARGGGTLALVYPETAGKDEGLLESAALAVFRSFTRSVLAEAGGEPYVALGFSSGETGDEAGFAAFIARQLDEANRRGSGKHHRYGKHGIFR
ncbi:MAG: hypothetical protein FWG46_05455 [Treponema sp.]|nr:hypothetical protein [Treponema sp.]